LQRNGIVAALAEAVVVIEAAERSGALNTAGWAAARSIPVFALPGDVDRPKAAGCNALIRDGATLVRNAGDVLADLGLSTLGADTVLARDVQPPREDPLEARLLTVLAVETRDLESLIDSAQAPTGTVLAALMRLEIDGDVERRSDGTFARLR
jgi:DNA processing protein